MPKIWTTWLIFIRELRDQLRDRRTLFTVLVLPLLIYPMLSIGLMQVAQFAKPSHSRVWLVGEIPESAQVPLVNGNRLANGLLSPSESELVTVDRWPATDDRVYDLVGAESWQTGKLDDGARKALLSEMKRLRLNAVVILSKSLSDSASNATEKQAILLVNSADSSSMVTGQRLQQALSEWNRQGLMQRLEQLDGRSASLESGGLVVTDVAAKKRATAIQWSRILPLILVIWALTGAFYPAVDLCAGEKERGTLETLLTSPASRIDIIGGKLLTVMAFSMATAILNLISIQFCGSMVLGSLAKMGSVGVEQAAEFPPLSIYPLLILMLVPTSLLFSSLALAVAAFARSSKEGQYYLMPLIMVSMPLMVIAMLPGSELNFGNAIVPLSGLLLLLQAMIEGEWRSVAMCCVPVVAVTLACSGLAVRWCVRQFSDESIMFRSGERIGISVWVRRWLQGRLGETSLKLALTCFTVILLSRFFGAFIFPAPLSWDKFWIQTVAVLVIAVAAPAVVMALIWTKRPQRALLLTRVPPWTLVLAILLAVLLHPTFLVLSQWVMWLYPPATSLGQTEQLLTQIFSGAPGLWAVVLVIAVAPAICEELAFRGFILSGLRARLDNWSALFISSLMFGFAHTILQQSIVTFFVGMVLGVIAIRCGSLWPCILYHLVHNALSVCMTKISPEAVLASPWLSQIWVVEQGMVAGYRGLATLIAAGFAVLLMAILFRNSRHRPDARWNYVPQPQMATP